MYLNIIIANFVQGIIALSWYNNIASSPRCIEDNQAIVEYYKIDEYQYMFFSERVPWNEAKIICPIYDAELAIVDSSEKAYTLAAAIADSNIDMEDIWIGGERLAAGNWTWTDNELIQSEAMDGFPPWIRNPDRPWKQCLAMDRFMVDSPLFVDLDCQLPKPFICQRDADGPANPDITLPSNIVKYGKRTYILYHTRITWGAAVAFCRMRGYRLATISNNEIAKVVSTAMLRSRPSFANAWVSGHYLHDNWEWLPNGQVIESYPDANNFPPWHHNSTNQTSGCILFDRHICAEPVFLAAKCDRRRDFLCEKSQKNNMRQKKNTIIKIDNSVWSMLLFLKELSWTDARDYCHAHRGYLAEVYDYEMMKTITTAMSDQASEPIHVWLGGMLVDKKWMWVRNNKSIPTTTDKTGFMPWCNIEEKEGDACLNMDREAHDKPSVYGLNCDMSQPFVCTLSDSKSKMKQNVHSEDKAKATHIDKTPAVDETLRRTCDQSAITLQHDTKTYEIFFQSYPYNEVLNECQHAGGKVAEINENNLEDLIAFIAKKAKICEPMNYWVAGNNNCSQLNIQQREVDVADCSIKQGFICEIVCSTPNSSNVLSQSFWKCDENDETENDLECIVRCDKNTILVGSDEVVCSNTAGWHTQTFKTTYLPICLSNDVVKTRIKDTINELKGVYPGFLFLVDESFSITVSQWWLQLQFIAKLIQMFPLNKNLPMGLILFSRYVNVVIPYNATDTCEVLGILSKVTVSKTRDFTFYKNALEEAENQIKKYQPTRKTIIFLISDGDNTGEEYDLIIEDLKQHHIFFSVGISHQPLNDLNIVASMKNDRLLMFKFPEFDSFMKFTNLIGEHRRKSLECPDHLD